LEEGYKESAQPDIHNAEDRQASSGRRKERTWMNGNTGQWLQLVNGAMRNIVVDSESCYPGDDFRWRSTASQSWVSEHEVMKLSYVGSCGRCHLCMMAGASRPAIPRAMI
jgi:hypothetical protein